MATTLQMPPVVEPRFEPTNPMESFYKGAQQQQQYMQNSLVLQKQLQEERDRQAMLAEWSQYAQQEADQDQQTRQQPTQQTPTPLPPASRGVAPVVNLPRIVPQQPNPIASPAPSTTQKPSAVQPTSSNSTEPSLDIFDSLNSSLKTNLVNEPIRTVMRVLASGRKITFADEAAKDTYDSSYMSFVINDNKDPKKNSRYLGEALSRRGLAARIADNGTLQFYSITPTTNRSEVINTPQSSPPTTTNTNLNPTPPAMETTRTATTQQTTVSPQPTPSQPIQQPAAQQPPAYQDRTPLTVKAMQLMQKYPTQIPMLAAMTQGLTAQQKQIMSNLLNPVVTALGRGDAAGYAAAANAADSAATALQNMGDTEHAQYARTMAKQIRQGGGGRVTSAFLISGMLSAIGDEKFAENLKSMASAEAAISGKKGSEDAIKAEEQRTKDVAATVVSMQRAGKSNTEIAQYAQSQGFNASIANQGTPQETLSVDPRLEEAAGKLATPLADVQRTQALTIETRRKRQKEEAFTTGSFIARNGDSPSAQEELRMQFESGSPYIIQEASGKYSVSPEIQTEVAAKEQALEKTKQDILNGQVDTEAKKAEASKKVATDVGDMSTAVLNNKSLASELTSFLNDYPLSTLRRKWVVAPTGGYTYSWLSLIPFVPSDTEFLNFRARASTLKARADAAGAQALSNVLRPMTTPDVELSGKTVASVNLEMPLSEFYRQLGLGLNYVNKNIGAVQSKYSWISTPSAQRFMTGELAQQYDAAITDLNATRETLGSTGKIPAGELTRITMRPIGGAAQPQPQVQSPVITPQPQPQPQVQSPVITPQPQPQPQVQAPIVAPQTVTQPQPQVQPPIPTPQAPPPPPNQHTNEQNDKDFRGL